MGPNGNSEFSWMLIRGNALTLKDGLTPFLPGMIRCKFTVSQCYSRLKLQLGMLRAKTSVKENIQVKLASFTAFEKVNDHSLPHSVVFRQCHNFIICNEDKTCM